MVSVPEGEKNFEDIFIRFDVIHERDRQRDGHRVTAKTALMHMHHAVKTVRSRSFHTRYRSGSLDVFDEEP